MIYANGSACAISWERLELNELSDPEEICDNLKKKLDKGMSLRFWLKSQKRVLVFHSFFPWKIELPPNPLFRLRDKEWEAGLKLYSFNFVTHDQSGLYPPFFDVSLFYSSRLSLTLVVVVVGVVVVYLVFIIFFSSHLLPFERRS